jgi:hypothetical protein
MMTSERDANGRFVPGQSGNPLGKKPGTRNRATVLREALRDGEDESVARVVIDKALAGNAVMARFVIGLLMPRPGDRDRPAGVRQRRGRPRGVERDDPGDGAGRDHAAGGAERDAAAGVSAEGDGSGGKGGGARAGEEFGEGKRLALSHCPTIPLSPRGRGSG